MLKSPTDVKKNSLSKEESTWDGPAARENMVLLRNKEEFAEHSVWWAGGSQRGLLTSQTSGPKCLFDLKTAE